MTDFPQGRAWIELDRTALAENVAFLRGRVPDRCRLMPALKAEAYGHGAVLMGRELNRLGVDAFCVACAGEGAQLRQGGVEGEILVLGYTHPAEFPLLERYGLTQTVVDRAYGEELDRWGRSIPVHVAVDTGMHRLGERSEHLEDIARLFQMKNLKVEGLFTHLCAADGQSPRERDYTKGQGLAFYQVVRALEARGIPRPKLHLQSSYGLLNYPEWAEDYARVGIALYGVLSTGADTEQWKGKLRPVLSLKARVAAVKALRAGECAGYGMAYTAGTDRTVAVLTIGYADGLPRALSGGRGEALLHGRRAPIIGRVCMDQTLVDVTGIPDVTPGEEAVLIGRSGREEISVCQWADRTGTITNEILSRLGPRLERSIK